MSGEIPSSVNPNEAKVIIVPPVIDKPNENLEIQNLPTEEEKEQADQVFQDVLNNPQEQKKSGGFGKRVRAAAAALVVALGIGGAAGCEGQLPTPTPIETPAPSPSPSESSPNITVEPSPTTSPTETPTEKPVETATPSPSPTETSTPTPTEVNVDTLQVEGCTKKVVDGKILFYAEANNSYGLEAGEFFGEFVENVNVVTGNEGTKTGGWALNSKAVHVLLEQSSAQTGEDCTKTKVVLPVDISGLKEGGMVNIAQASFINNGVDYGSGLMINFGASDLFVSDGLDTGSEGAKLGNSSGPSSITFLFENGDKLADQNFQFYVIGNKLMYSSDNFSNDSRASLDVYLGEKFVQAKSRLYVKTINEDMSPSSTTTKDIFLFQNSPVFLKADNTSPKNK